MKKFFFRDAFNILCEKWTHHNKLTLRINNQNTFLWTDDFWEETQSSIFQRRVGRGVRSGDVRHSDVQHLVPLDQLSPERQQIGSGGSRSSRNRNHRHVSRAGDPDRENLESEFHRITSSRGSCSSSWLGRVPDLQGENASASLHRKSHHQRNQTNPDQKAQVRKKLKTIPFIKFLFRANLLLNSISNQGET